MDASEQLRPFVPRLIYDWVRRSPDQPVLEIDGSLAFIDISGFTSLTERLARRGKVGAEELNDVLNGLFSELIPVAYEGGASLVKWGGDAALLLFDGEEHAARACRAAIDMQKTIRRAGHIMTSAGQVRLRMSVGISSGAYTFFLVGDPSIHRELVIAGPAATETVLMEQTAQAGEVAISRATAAAIDPDALGVSKETAVLLRSAPDVPAHPAPPPPDPAGLDLATFVPVAIRDYVLTGQVHPEHRHITAAFIEFGGTDDLLASEGPQATAAAIDECLRTVQAAALRHDVGFFESDVSRNGWRIMLIVGAPMSPGGDEDRMLATLRTVLETTLPLPVKIGANAGHVFSAYFGPPFRKTYSVKGDAVNLAARLMAKAPPGQLYTTASVLDRSGTDFELTELEPFLVKGKAKPIRAWSVGDRVGGNARVRSATGSPLLGRDKELEVLRSALDDARSGIAALVELSGEEGIGSSRLAEELVSEASDFAMVGAVGETYTAWTPYVAWRGVLRELFALSWEDPTDVVVERLRTIVEAADPTLLPWLPLIATAADAEVEPTPEVRDLRPEFLRQKLHEAMRAFLRAVVVTPTLFVFEDAHLMDEASSDLLSAIVSAGIEDRPWLFVTTRLAVDGGFQAPDVAGVQRLEVGPIAREDAVALAEAATDEAPLPGYVIQQAVDRAGGNPQFLLDLVASAAEGVGTLPESVEAAAVVRIDRLAASDRELVRRASIFGLAFHPRFFDDVLDEGMPKPDAATWARLEEFFDEEDDGYLRFRRAVIRDAAYGGLPFRVRQRLHETAGRLFEEMVPDPDESAGLLSLHYAAAARWDKAYRYATIAAGHASEIFANVEAIRFYQRALEAGRKNGEEPTVLASLSERLGDAYSLLGRYEEAAQAFSSARRALSAEPVAQAWIFSKHARIPFRAGAFSQAIRLVNRGLRVLEDVDGPEAAAPRAQLLALRLGARASQGRYRDAIRLAHELIDETDRMPRETKVLEAKARALYLLDGILIEQGKLDEAHYFEPALAIYQEIGDLSGQSVAMMNHGTDLYWLGRWDEAVDLWERAREVRVKMGDEIEAAVLAMNLGEVRLDRGHLDEAEKIFRDAYRVCRSSNSITATAAAAEYLGRVASRLGRPSDAMLWLEEARDLFEQAGYKGPALETEARIAEALVQQRAWQDALPAIDEALERASAVEGLAIQTPLLHRLRAVALMQAGRFDEARPELELSLELGRAREAIYEVGLTLDVLAAIEEQLGDPSASAHRQQSREILDRLGVGPLGDLAVAAP